MIYDIVIPALGATGGDVILEDWRAQPGHFVKAGAALFVVTTDKATVEVEAFHDGYLRETLVSPGATVPVQTVVARMTDTPDEPLEVSSSAQAVTKEDRNEQMPELPKGNQKHTGRKLASPLARRMAKELGLDLSTIPASGSIGQILKRDILQAMEQTHTGGGVRHMPLSSMRRAIAHRTQKSNIEIPHFHGAITIDMTAAKDMLKQIVVRAEKNNWAAPTITDLSIRAAALALRQTPSLNASFQGEEVILFEDINIGLVIGLEEGLLVPVVHQADKLNLFLLAAATRRLHTSAKNGQLTSSQLSGATFTISNLGMYGLDSFSAVINPPEAGILALGAAKEAPAAWQGSIALRWMMTATLAADHRLVDGINVAKFLGAFKELLENPLSLTLEAPQEGNV